MSPPWRRAGERRRATRRVVLVVELVAIGLAAGLGFPAAVSTAGEAAGGSLAGDIERALRRLHGVGIRAAAEATPGPIGDLFRLAARSAATGAPLAGAVAGRASALRDRMHQDALRQIRTLPVRLAFPLALLILPGFVLMTLGPAFLESLGRVLSAV